MIYLYSGTPGSGKSYHMALDIVYAARRKQHVISNFYVDLGDKQDYLTVVENDKLTPELLEDFATEYFRTHKFREGALRFYFDECQTILGARTWTQRSRESWMRFFHQHRKYGYDVYLVAQNAGFIDKQARDVIEYEVMHRKVNNIGIFGLVLTCLTLGHSVFVCNRYYYGMKYRLGSEWLLGMQHIYRRYNTRKAFDAKDSGQKGTAGHAPARL